MSLFTDYIITTAPIEQPTEAQIQLQHLSVAQAHAERIAVLGSEIAKDLSSIAELTTYNYSSNTTLVIDNLNQRIFDNLCDAKAKIDILLLDNFNYVDDSNPGLLL